MSRRNANNRSWTPGAPSWSASTGVTDSVTPSPPGPSNTSNNGRYTVAAASNSHSSPNGHVPKPST